MEKKLVLYWNLGSQPARAVKALLDIGKIPCELITKDVIKQQTRTKQFLQMNPFGQIPFLVHGDLKVGQSNAILIYLCETYNSIPSHYYGSTPQQRAKTNQFLSWYQYYFRPALFKIIKIKVYGYLRKKIPFKAYQITSAKKQMFEALKTFDQLLKINNQKFTTGEKPTIADLLIYFELTNMIYYQERYDNYAYVARWAQEVQAIPQVSKISQAWQPVSTMTIKVLNSIKPQDEAKGSL